MTHGLFEWVDVSVPDLEAGARFYEAVFGWRAEPSRSADGSDTSYRMLRKDGRLAAGMVQTSAAQIPGSGMWNAYVTVDDATVIATRAEGLGAQVVVPPMDIGAHGIMTYIRDPQGAYLGFWEPGTHRGAEAYNESGFLTWNGLATRDFAGSKAFYSELMPEWTFDDLGPEFSMIRLGERENAGLSVLGEEFPIETPTRWRAFFVVDDAHESLRVVEREGGEALGPVVDSPFGPVVRVADPFGAAFLIIGPMDVGES
jgi:uncharacterized protein